LTFCTKPVRSTCSFHAEVTDRVVSVFAAVSGISLNFVFF
jgi:hypothetical protein